MCELCSLDNTPAKYSSINNVYADNSIHFTITVPGMHHYLCKTRKKMAESYFLFQELLLIIDRNTSPFSIAEPPIFLMGMGFAASSSLKDGINFRIIEVRKQYTEKSSCTSIFSRICAFEIFQFISSAREVRHVTYN